jgi:signal transduction histidine kinase/ActR/RegA family two-component response regulator
MKGMSSQWQVSNGEFETERTRIINHALTLGALICGILVPMFAGLDYIFKPEQTPILIEIRFFVTLICFAIYLVSRRPIGNRFAVPLTALLAWTVCGSIAMMCWLGHGPRDPYYAGINLPLLGLGIMFPMNFASAVIIMSVVWLFYFIPNFMIINLADVPIFISNNFFLIATIVISVAGTRFNERHIRNQWTMYCRLRAANQKIKNHAKELEENVRERSQKLLQSERLAVVGQLAGGVAHDFNNHLTAILGISELLLSSLPPEDPIRDDITNINKVGLRSADLVKQLLAFSRRQIMMPKVLNLNDVLHEVQKMLRRLIGEHIELIIIPDTTIGYVKADPVQMEQIILNLSVNARDAMPGGGKLIIETSNIRFDENGGITRQASLPAGDYIMLAITDTGMGMSEEIRLKIFEPFFTTKEQGMGTGLGLATVYGIVKQSNGDIVVYSEVGKGTTFKIFLPCVEGPVHIVSNEPKPEYDLRGTGTILLVEDEESVRCLTARILEKQGYKVIQADEGRRALELIKDHEGPIDLLVTDVVLPYMDGKTLAECVVRERIGTKVLFISGYTDQTVILKGIMDSKAEFLQKPYSMHTLSRKIQTILKCSEPAVIPQ